MTTFTYMLVVASLAAACQSGVSAKPSPTAVPKVYTSTVFEHVTYPDGKPTGKYDDNPWVQTVRVYEAELAWARTHYDWTSPQLTKIAREKDISNFAWWQDLDARDKAFTRMTPAGPWPLDILNIENDSKDTLLITACRANNWYVTSGNVYPNISNTSGNYVEYVVSINANGYGYVFGEFNHSKRSCDISKAKSSYFEPLPKYSEPSEGDFKLTDAIRDS